MNGRRRASWLVYALGALSAGAIVAAVLVVGPAGAGSATVTRTATAAKGLVQSTVSGSGNLAPASQLDLGFKTGGTVTHIYVKQGQQVAKGQLLATLDPQTAEVTLQQARAGLQSAQASLASEEETGGEGTGAQSKGGGEASAKAAAAPTTTSTGRGETTTPPTTSTPAATTPAKSTHESAAKETSSATTESSSSGAVATVSEATREANLASARAAVRSDRLTVQSDEQAVADTKLYAPEEGTIASLSGEVGEVVSGGGTTRAAASSESSSSSTGATSPSSSTNGATGSTSSSSFAVLSNLSSMRLVVPLSESEVRSVRAGQIATVTVEALEGKKLAAHVREVSILSTSNSGVVSYDVTFQVDQMLEGLKPGMSATAEVVIEQASGVNVPTSAISGGSVTVLHGSKRETRQVTTGLAGDSATIVTSGLNAGETVLLPTATTSSGSSGTSSLRSSFRGLGSGGTTGGFGAAGGAPPGGGAVFRGGG